MTDTPEEWAEFYAQWDEFAAAVARGEPPSADLAARAWRSTTDESDRIEMRAVLHVARFYGDEFAAEVLDALADDVWWSTTPPRCRPFIERDQRQ